MKKFRSFLSQTSEITNGQRLTIIVGTLGLMGIAYWRNYAPYKDEMKNIDLEMEKEDLEIELDNLKNRLKEKSIEIQINLSNQKRDSNVSYFFVTRNLQGVL